MAYKTILVHVDDARNIDARIELAANLALAENAHLIGTAMTGISRFLFESVAPGTGMPSVEPYLKTLRERAQNALNKFESIAQRMGVPSFEKRLADDEAAGGIALQARYCDLVVLGQYDPDGTASSVYADLPEYVAMNSGCAVLMVPYATAVRSLGNRVLIAWNGSSEAAKAVHGAIPLLQKAQIVEVAVFDSEQAADTHGQQPGADIALYLARHNIKVDVIEKKTDGDIGEALLSLTSDLNSDLLVMGCYGHSRFREVLLGGATRTVLQSMTIPVMMSH